MEFRHLEAFVSVAERESFTRAADHMHLTQSAVSQLVRRLEEEIGEPLFVRDGRIVRLTRMGFDLLPEANEILSLRQMVVEKVAPRPESISGVLRIGTSASATAFLWAPMYQAFARTYPNIDLDVRTTSHTVKTAADILSGELDIGFLPFPLTNPRLEGRVLANHDAPLVAAPNHPLVGKEVTIDDLAAERFILFEQGMNFREIADFYFREMGIAPQIVLQSNDTNLIRAMAEVGFGIAFLPDWGIQRELAERSLVRLRIPDAQLYEEFGLVFLKRGICLTAKEFIRFCEANPELIPAVARKRLPESWVHFSLRHVEESHRPRAGKPADVIGRDLAP